ncbi:glutaredoxin family protein [Candidatus Uhrbacteria bacterium]|nr:glutaredoxin family protein [Candidatus Uhrbacteria bacterium]
MKKVTIYTTPTCTYCKMTKDYFQKNNVLYEERDVTTDDAAREEMIGKSHQMGVPVIDIEGEIIVGFNRPELARALRLK